MFGTVFSSRQLPKNCRHDLSFRLNPATSRARLKHDTAENPKRFRLLCATTSFTTQCDVMNLSRGDAKRSGVCNTFQGRDDDSLMIFLLIYELIIILWSRK